MAVVDLESEWAASGRPWDRESTIKNGTRLASQVCDTQVDETGAEVLVTRAGAGTLIADKFW
jgi:hypothetical protein